MRIGTAVLAALLLLGGCGDKSGDGGKAAAPEAAQAEGIAASVRDVEAATRAAPTPLPAPAEKAPAP